MTYAALDSHVRQLAKGLKGLGVKKECVVASDLSNCAENLMLQLAVSHIGASFATAKDEAALAAKVGEVHLAVIDHPGSALSSVAQSLSLPPVLLHDAAGQDKLMSFEELAGHSEDVEDAAASPDGLFANYNGSKMTQAEAARLGSAAASALNGTADDITCVSITLCHAFGMGSGVGSALHGGGAVVLPAADGIRGCGDPKQRAEVTAEVLRQTGATLLFADTHIIKQMPAEGGAAALRAGLVKVSSGTDIFDTGLEYGGVKLSSIGKAPQ